MTHRRQLKRYYYSEIEWIWGNEYKDHNDVDNFSMEGATSPLFKEQRPKRTNMFLTVMRHFTN